MFWPEDAGPERESLSLVYEAGTRNSGCAGGFCTQNQLLDGRGAVTEMDERGIWREDGIIYHIPWRSTTASAY